jgi:uncharacterized Fe-S radical SAM superfamily protein PflX
MQSLEKVVTVFQHQKFKEKHMSNISFCEKKPTDKVVVVVNGIRRSVPALELATVLALVGNSSGGNLDNIFKLLKDVIDPDNYISDLVEMNIDLKSPSKVIATKFFVTEEQRKLKEVIANKRKELEGLNAEIAQLEAKFAKG